MQTPVTVELKTSQLQDDKLEEFELHETGTLTQKNDNLYLRYVESKNQAQTTLKIKADELMLTRRQKELELQLVLRVDEKTNAKYKTVYGTIFLTASCQKYVLEKDGQASGVLKVAYELYSGDDLLGKYKLELQFKP